MYSFNQSSALDVGISTVAYYFGAGIAVLSFVMVTFIEAKIMSKRFHFPLPQSFRYSFIINTISTIIGFLIFWLGFDSSIRGPFKDIAITELAIFVHFMAFPPLFFEYIRQLILASALTLIIEYATLMILVKPRLSYKAGFYFIVLANLASYAALFILPPITLLVMEILL
jgi:hypothetical protein